MSKQIEKIPDAERDVLVCLNRLEKATVKEIRDELTSVRKLQVSSVLTLLKRLEAKVRKPGHPNSRACDFKSSCSHWITIG